MKHRVENPQEQNKGNQAFKEGNQTQAGHTDVSNAQETLAGVVCSA